MSERQKIKFHALNWRKFVLHCDPIQIQMKIRGERCDSDAATSKIFFENRMVKFTNNFYVIKIRAP